MNHSGSHTSKSAWARRLLGVVLAYFAWAIAFALLESTFGAVGTVATLTSLPAIALAGVGGLAARWIGGRGLWVSIVVFILVAVDSTVATFLAPSENQPAVDLLLRGIPLATLLATAIGTSTLPSRRI